MIRITERSQQSPRLEVCRIYRLYMESPASLINKIISISLLDPRIEAVILTGSRGRDQHIDRYSDVDIELIGYGASELFNDKKWVNHFGHSLIALHLRNLEEHEPDWPTCLVIYEQGRKVDFTFAEPERLQKMKREGLDSTFSRGFVVLLDKSGITDNLASTVNPNSLLPKVPNETQFTDLLSDFWFEAHQVSIALARDELWVAWSRSADMKQFFLSSIELLVSLKSHAKKNVWYNGCKYHEWMPEHFIDALETIFDCSTAQKAALSLHCLMSCFLEATTELSLLLGYDDKQNVGSQMQELVTGILKDNGLIAEGA